MIEELLFEEEDDYSYKKFKLRWITWKIKDDGSLDVSLIKKDFSEIKGLKNFEVYYTKRIWESLSFYLPSIFLLFNPFPLNAIAVLGYVVFIFVFKVIIKLKFSYSLFLMDIIKGKKFYDKNFKDKFDLT